MVLRWAGLALVGLVTLPYWVPVREPCDEITRLSSTPSVPQDTRPAHCRVTLPADGVYEPPWPTVFGLAPRTPERFFYGTEKLWTILPADGTWRGVKRSKPGEPAYSDKFAWFRTYAAFAEDDGLVTMTGRRVDGPAPSFVETFGYPASPGKDTPAFIIVGISIPMEGCWEITGHYGDAELTFTEWVVEVPRKDAAVSSPPVQKKPPRRVQVEGDKQARELVYRVLPEIPAAAREARVYGKVVLHAIIGTDGRPRELSYVSGPEALMQAAMDAVKWYQYRINVDDSVEPYESNEVDTTIAVDFPVPKD